jgi:CXXX repeat peptide maturase
MLKYLLVVLSEDSTSFCHYEPRGRKRGDEGLIPLDRLEAAVLFALKNNLKVNFLYPGRKLGRAYDKVIERVDHVKIAPFAARSRYPGAILVVESSHLPAAAELAPLRGEIFIFRLRRADLPRLAADLGRLLPRAKRVNLVLTDVEGYGEAEYAEYRRQLEKVVPKVLKLAAGKTPPELNVLTDRLALGRMNNCEAGLAHLTVAPNGRLYLCPAFYYADPKESLGGVRRETVIGNRRLLELKYAPICRICDAYQCKRCVHLNRTLTLELNTPSSQQCRLAHLEREASRLYLGRLRRSGPGAAGLADIPEIAYDDPFDVAVEKKMSIADFKKL